MHNANPNVEDDGTVVEYDYEFNSIYQIFDDKQDGTSSSLHRSPYDYTVEVECKIVKDWHIDRAAEKMGLSSGGVVANLIKARFDAIMQGHPIAKAAGSRPDPNNAKQYGQGFRVVREGDPKGFLGWCFAVTRSVYQACETIPVLNSSRLWNAVDHLVLGNDNDSIPLSNKELTF